MLMGPRLTSADRADALGLETRLQRHVNILVFLPFSPVLTFPLSSTFELFISAVFPHVFSACVSLHLHVSCVPLKQKTDRMHQSE